MQSTKNTDFCFNEDEFDTEVIFRKADQEVQVDEEEEDEIIAQEPETPKLKSLPAIPEFTPMSHIFQERDGYVTLPRDWNMDGIEPMSIFNLFFNDEMLDVIVDNTNEYAKLNLEDTDKENWSDLERDDIIIWIAIVIYQGIHKESAIRDYWNTSNLAPIHAIKELMSYLKFRMIRKYLHISKPDKTSKTSKPAKTIPFYEKLEPLLSHLRVTSQKLYVPKCNVSVDEMMVRFSGRSKDIVRMKGKPIPKGYKIMSLCDSGYTYAFLPTSKDEPCEVTAVPSLTYTANIVNHLVQQLPHKSRAYNIFMDNYFSSINLFKYFKENNIGACGTSKLTSVFTNSFNIEKNKKYAWNTRSAVEVDGVLAVFWQDNGPVKMLTTIHGISAEGRNWDIETSRKKPRKTSTNAANIRKLFGEDEHEKKMMIPQVINDYNHNMNGVDIADQYRSYYNTQRKCNRNWLPLFYWLLDTAIINSYLLFNKINKKEGKKEITHKRFRQKLLWGLVSTVRNKSVNLRNTNTKPVPQKRKRATKNFVLDPKRLSTLTAKHWPTPTDQRGKCAWCSYLAQKNNRDSQQVSRIKVWCLDCNLPLCFSVEQNCHDAYHTPE